MANLPSARKRAKQGDRKRAMNRARKAALKTETRKLLEVLSQGDAAQAQDQFVRVTKKLDQVAAKGTLHKNTVARRKSRLARQINAIAAAKKS